MKIYLGSDHAGFEHKKILKDLLEKKDHEVIDLGPESYDAHDDYPDHIRPVAQSVAADHTNGVQSRGIVIGGSGQGEAIVANRFSNVRCVVYYGGNTEIILLSRKHNDANMLSLGARFIPEGDLEEIVDLWLSEKFSGDERHARRIGKID